MSVTKYYSQLTNRLIEALPSWSSITRNALSTGQRLINLIALEYDSLLEKFNNMNNQWNIHTANIDEIYETWVVEIENSGQSLEVIPTTTGFSGYYPVYDYDVETSLYTETGEYIARDLVLVEDNNEEVFYKYPPTAFTSRLIYTNPDGDRLLACQYHNKALRIKSSVDGLEKLIRFNKYIDHANEESEVDFVSEAFEGTYIADTEETTTYLNAYHNYRPEEPMITDTIRIFRAGETDEEQPSDITIPSGYYFIASGVLSHSVFTITKPWNNDNSAYNELYDFDHDGVINEAEYNKILSNLNRYRYETGMTDELWLDNFAQYDLDGDDTISANDLDIIRGYMTTTNDPDTDIVLFKEPGQYLIRYNTMLGGGISGYTVYDDLVQIWKNDDIRGSLPIAKASGYKDIAYESATDTFYFSDNGDKCIRAELYDANANVVDTYKITLPITSFTEEICGITTSRDGLIYTVGSDSEHDVGKIYRINTHSDDIRGTVVSLDVYPEYETTTRYDAATANLPSTIYGISHFHGDRLLVTAQEGVYLLSPLYDVALYSADTQRVHFRSWHTYISNTETGPEYYRARPYWNRVWNEFDEAAWKVGINRLLGENNELLKRRIIDVHENYAYDNEQGYINGITRELGLDRFDKAKSVQYAALSNPPADPSLYDIEIIPSISTLLYLQINEIVEEPVYNLSNIIVRYKYLLYGNHPYSSETDVLLASIDGSLVTVYVTFDNQYGDAMRITYKYYDEDFNLKTGDEVFPIQAVTPEPLVPLEVFRIDNQSRFMQTKYGFYDENGYPTQKLESLVTNLRQIDNTTFHNYISNVSRYNTWEESYSGINAIPEYWQ